MAAKRLAAARTTDTLTVDAEMTVGLPYKAALAAAATSLIGVDQALKGILVPPGVFWAVSGWTTESLAKKTPILDPKTVAMIIAAAYAGGLTTAVLRRILRASRVPFGPLLTF